MNRCVNSPNSCWHIISGCDWITQLHCGVCTDHRVQSHLTPSAVHPGDGHQDYVHLHATCGIPGNWRLLSAGGIRRVSGTEWKHLFSKAKLHRIKHSHYMDRWSLPARLCICPEIFPQTDSVQTLQKLFRCEYKLRSPVCIHLQKITYAR